MNVLTIDALLCLVFVAGISSIVIHATSQQQNQSLVVNQILAYDIADIQMRGVKIHLEDLPSYVCVEIDSSIQKEKIGNCEEPVENSAAVEFLELSKGQARVSRVVINYG